jgi:hypothetical protein
MRKFKRQTGGASGGASGGSDGSDITLDFGAAAAKIARVFEPGEYRLRVEAARVIYTENVSVVLDLIELDSNSRVATGMLWVDGPNSAVGNLATENQHLVAQLLTLAKLPTTGNVSSLISKLAGLEFDAHLVLAVDNRSGRSFNAIADIYTDAAS